MSAAARPRVLVGEDEFLVYLALEEELRANGFDVIGPFCTIDEIREALRRETIDLALLDINLGGEMIYPVADELMAKNIPFLFLSGYAARTLPDRYREIPRLDKPYDPAVLLVSLRRLVAAQPQELRLP